VRHATTGSGPSGVTILRTAKDATKGVRSVFEFAGGRGKVRADENIRTGAISGLDMKDALSNNFGHFSGTLHMARLLPRKSLTGHRPTRFVKTENKDEIEKIETFRHRDDDRVGGIVRCGGRTASQCHPDRGRRRSDDIQSEMRDVPRPEGRETLRSVYSRRGIGQGHPRRKEGGETAKHAGLQGQGHRRSSSKSSYHPHEGVKDAAVGIGTVEAANNTTEIRVARSVGRSRVEHFPQVRN
jgi:hypothetical protein